MNVWSLIILSNLFIGTICYCQQNESARVPDGSHKRINLHKTRKPVMHKAAECNDWETIIALYNRGNPVDISDNKEQTPLHIAAIHGHIETAMVLLQRRANPNARNTAGKTPLHMAAEHGHSDMVDLLLQFGAQPAEKSSTDDTPAELAATHLHIDLMIKLIESAATKELQKLEVPIH